MLTRADVIAGWNAFLGRTPDEAMIAHSRQFADRAELIGVLAGSDEFGLRQQLGYVTLSDALRAFSGDGSPDVSGNAAANHVDVASYFVPTELSVTRLPLTRVLLIGDCLLAGWQDVIRRQEPELVVDHVLFSNGAAFAGQIERPIGDYDCQVLQIPLRVVLPDHELFIDTFDDAALQRCLDQLDMFLATALEQTRGAPLFVLNYPVPQQNALGRMLPRYDLRNPAYVFERLNAALAERLAGRPEVMLLDIDQLAGGIGRRLIQDDGFWLSSHGGLMNDYDLHADGVRLEPTLAHSVRYPLEVDGFIRTAWAEVVAMLRTRRGIDSVKMVCVDLDDTLWHGVAAEADSVDGYMVEGWPLGFAEALMMLKRRGIILAIASKNDAARVAEIWPQIFGHRLRMDDFAIRKIDWTPKADNIRAAIAEANVLPESVVFIDDNPVERAAVAEAIPGIRVLSAPPLDWRRILLWSSETQVPVISEESTRRTAMIQAQVVREKARSSQSHADFVAGLEVKVTLATVRSADAAEFARALELVNKTNQFNTTGVRWSHADAEAFFAEGGEWRTFRVADRFTNYGLVGVLAIRDAVIEQFVLSCRVFGLGVEVAVLDGIVAEAGDRPITAMLNDTGRNIPCQGVYRDAGWQESNGRWVSGEPVTRDHALMLVDDGR